MKIEDFKNATATVTKKWTKQRKREERNSRCRFFRQEYIYSDRVHQTDAAWEVIPGAYAKVAGPNNRPAHARQIFYAARPAIQDATGRDLKSPYFTQTLLPKYMADHPEETADWRVVYDARGQIMEPHAKKNNGVIRLGTIEVDNYLAEIQDHTVEALDSDELSDFRYPTRGPAFRYSAVLFIEKEGFFPLFADVKLAERYDLAIMSTKGQSVVASRKLVDHLCGGPDGVPLLVLHDLDKAGFEISKALTTESVRADGFSRYEFCNEIESYDLGLRLADVEKWGLDSERVKFTGGFSHDSIATPEEQEFMRGDQRVELNAFTSDDFISYIEGKLDEHGIKKVIPSGDDLKTAYTRAYHTSAINAEYGELAERAAELAEEAKFPRGLRGKIEARLKENPELPWDQVLAEIAEERRIDEK